MLVLVEEEDEEEDQCLVVNLLGERTDRAPAVVRAVPTRSFKATDAGTGGRATGVLW